MKCSRSQMNVLFIQWYVLASNDMFLHQWNVLASVNGSCSQMKCSCSRMKCSCIQWNVLASMNGSCIQWMFYSSNEMFLHQMICSCINEWFLHPMKCSRSQMNVLFIQWNVLAAKWMFYSSNEMFLHPMKCSCINEWFLHAINGHWRASPDFGLLRIFLKLAKVCKLLMKWRKFAIICHFTLSHIHPGRPDTSKCSPTRFSTEICIT
jgi:hypothetical protein